MQLEQKDSLFWNLATPMIDNGFVEKGTMMGFPCLRIRGKFFASQERSTKDLIVKLPADRVTELINQGQALPFSPNGRVFKEWALIDELNEERWRTLIQEALDFVGDGI